MCNDQSDDNSKAGSAANPPRPIIADDKSVRRTVVLRIRRQADLDALTSEINASSASIVSKGAGVWVIEGTGDSIEKLRSVESVIEIEEPGQLQMKRSIKTPGGSDIDSGF